MLSFILISALDSALAQGDLDDELAMVQRAQKMDESAWQMIYDRYYSRLFGYLYYRLGDPDEAEELVAQVFERAVKNIRRYQYRGHSLGAWLNRIAANLVNDRHRQQQRQPTPLTLQESWVGHGDDPAEHALHSERSHILIQALNQLTPEQREVILLRFVARMTSPEIAQQMGKTTGAIKSLQHRALAALRRELEALHAQSLL